MEKNQGMMTQEALRLVNIFSFFIKATLYTHGKLDLASKIVGSIVSISKLMPLNSSLDGIHFQHLYKRCCANRSIESEASREEINLIRPYFDLITSFGMKVRREE